MRRSRRSPWFKPFIALGIASALTLGAWAGLANSIFFSSQLRLSDALFPGTGRDPRIVVVGIDEESLAAIGRWPWDRSVHARLIDTLAQQGAAWIGYDVTFGQSSEPDEDQALADAVARAANVVLGESVVFEGVPEDDLLRASEVLAPIPTLASAAVGVGHVNTFPDTDGVVRALPPLIQGPDRAFIPSLALALAERALGQAGQPVTTRPDGVQVGALAIPTGDLHLLDVNYTASFPEFSAIQVLQGAIPDGAFDGKIVVVGATATGLGDLVPTPIDKSNEVPGVVVHANALNTILTGNFLDVEPRSVTLGWVLALALLVTIVVAYLPLWLSPFIGAATLVGYFALVFVRFDSGTVMNMVYPPLGAVLAYVSTLGVRYLTEVRERKYVTNVFGRYLAKDVVAEVLSSPGGAVATLEGASRPLAVLFADLRGFTAASEDAAPTEVVAALNEYLNAMTTAVVEERGTIDKFMGDCVMAFWGAPRPDPDFAVRSVRAAMRMQDRIDAAMREGPAQHLKVKGCGVGLSLGEAVVGNIGSAERLDYTAIGDTVNTASRLCGVAGAGEIVVTEELAAALPDTFRLGELPPLKVKGKAKVLKVFQVLREGQEARSFAEGETTDATEDKGHFEPIPEPPKAAGYAPVEPTAGGTDDATAPDAEEAAPSSG